MSDVTAAGGADMVDVITGEDTQPTIRTLLNVADFLLRQVVPPHRVLAGSRGVTSGPTGRFG